MNKTNNIMLNYMENKEIQATGSLQKVNPYSYVSQLITNSAGNTGDQSDEICEKFIDGLFDSQCLELIQDCDGNDEWHFCYNGFSGHGSTPAKAVFNCMQENMK